MRIIFCLLVFVGFSNAAGIIHYDVDSCLLANIEATIDVHGVTSQNIKNSSGECGVNVTKSAIIIPFNNSETLELTFDLKNGDVFLTMLEVKYKTPKDGDQIALGEVNERLSSLDKYYECDQLKTYKLKDSDGKNKNVTVNFQYMKVQAFGVKNGNFSKYVETCDQPDSTTSSPISTGRTEGTTENTEATTENTEATTEKTEATTSSSEATTENTEATTQNTEATTEKTEATTENTDATTSSSEATTENTEATTEKTEATTSSSEATTENTEATTEKTEATTENTDATTQNTEATTMTPTVTTHIPVTAPPRSSETNINVTDNHGVVCIIAKFNATLTIPYEVKKVKKSYIYHIAGVSETTGNCGTDEQSVLATLHNGWKLGMVFTKSSTSKATRRLLASDTYQMSNLTLTYNLNGVPSATPGDVHVFNSSNRNKVDVGESFQCNAEEEIMMGTVKFDTKDLRVEAFRKSKTATYSSSERCSADATPGSNVVPIVVGVSLGVLVIVIVVAYLIGRRRSRRQAEGYQSLS